MWVPGREERAFTAPRRMVRAERCACQKGGARAGKTEDTQQGAVTRRERPASSPSLPSCPQPPAVVLILGLTRVTVRSPCRCAYAHIYFGFASFFREAEERTWAENKAENNSQAPTAL